MSPALQLRGCPGPASPRPVAQHPARQRRCERTAVGRVAEAHQPKCSKTAHAKFVGRGVLERRVRQNKHRNAVKKSTQYITEWMAWTWQGEESVTRVNGTRSEDRRGRKGSEQCTRAVGRGKGRGGSKMVEHQKTLISGKPLV